MLNADQFEQVKELIAAAELRLRRLKRLRAGYEDGHGWRYCTCGETKQLIADRAAPYCTGCDRLAVDDTRSALYLYHPMNELHYRGMHDGDPAPNCMACIVPNY